MQWSQTPLHIAASAGRADVAKLLILHKANISATDYVGDKHWLWEFELGLLEKVLFETR